MVATAAVCMDMGKACLLPMAPSSRLSPGCSYNLALLRSAGTASASTGLAVGVLREPASYRRKGIGSSSVSDPLSTPRLTSSGSAESSRRCATGCAPSSCRSALSPSHDFRRGAEDDAASLWESFGVGGRSSDGMLAARIPRDRFPLGEGHRSAGRVRDSPQSSGLRGGGPKQEADAPLTVSVSSRGHGNGRLRDGEPRGRGAQGDGASLPGLASAAASVLRNAADGGGAVFLNDESDADEVYNGWEVSSKRGSRKRMPVIDVEVGEEDGGHVGPSLGINRLRMLPNSAVEIPETNGASPGINGASSSGVIVETKMLAAVDMGTNSFHMVVVRADAQGRFQIVDVEKDDVRLGRGSTNMNVITPEAEERAIAAIKRFQKIAKIRKAEMRVVATSAVREARNRRTFIDRIYSATGLDVEVLSGREEACLIYQGILQAMPIYEKTVLTVDIGGGSTEFVVGKAGKPLFATSLKLGHIRLSERCLGGGKVVEKAQIEELRRQIRIVLADSGVIEAVRNHNFDVAIGSSGTIETIVEMIHQDTVPSNSMPSQNGQGEKGDKVKQAGEKEKGEKGEKGEKEKGEKGEKSKQSADKAKLLNAFKEKEFTKDELAQVVRKLGKARTLEQRMKLPGLSERRADVIVGGAILLEEIFSGLGIERMRVSPYALREGVIVDTLSRTFDDYNPSTDIRRSSLLSLARRFNIDRRKASARHSAMLARQILAGLQTCRSGGRECMTDAASELDETDAELMEAATILHYVGMFISHKGYHKHSHYLIKNNEHLLGYSPMEIEIIALLARYHRKKVPTTKDEDFAKLPKEVQAKICSMCAVIRVAVALDRCDSGAVEVVNVLQDDNSCILAVTPQVDPATGVARDVDLELWAARSELAYFEKIFNRPTSIVIADRMDLDSLQEDGSNSLSS